MKRGKTAIIMVLCIVLCGCTQSEKTTEEEITLSFMMPQSHYKQFFQEEIQRFEEEYPRYHIDVLRIPDNQWIDVAKMKAATGEMTDLIRIDKGLMADIGVDKFVEMKDEENWYLRVRPEQLENKKIDGKLYGLPIGSSSSVGLIYNQSVFEKLKITPPRNMEELRSICALLKENGYTPLFISDKDSWTTTIGFSESVSQIMTDDVYEKLMSGEMKWNNEEYCTILEEFADLRTEGYTNINYKEATYDSAVEAIASGQAVMYMSGQFFINDVHDIDEDLNLGMVPIPYKGDILTIKSGEGMFAISVKSKYIEEAKLFLEWFSQPENMNEFNAGWNHMPVFKDQKMELPQWQQKLYENYIETGKTALEINERFSGIDLSELWSLQQRMVLGEMSVEEVLEQWQAIFEQQAGL